MASVTEWLKTLRMRSRDELTDVLSDVDMCRVSEVILDDLVSIEALAKVEFKTLTVRMILLRLVGKSWSDLPQTSILHHQVREVLSHLRQAVAGLETVIQPARQVHASRRRVTVGNLKPEGCLSRKVKSVVHGSL